APVPYREGDAFQWLASVPIQMRRGEALPLAITDAQDGSLLGSIDLSFGQEHSDVTAVTVQGTKAQVLWDSYEGADFTHVRHQGTVSYANGRLAIQDQKDSYSPEYVAEDIAMAGDDKKRSALKDPQVVPNDLWQLLVTNVEQQDTTYTLDENSRSYGCATEGNKATCLISGVAPGPIETSYTVVLTKTTGTFYGWRVTSWE
ncbi:MAG: hypothetical protein JWR83_3570, partial [Aeromicrobium sp.]|nr:hypothetical protein [Aeromicrobium sp.]